MSVLRHRDIPVGADVGECGGQQVGGPFGRCADLGRGSAGWAAYGAGSSPGCRSAGGCRSARERARFRCRVGRPNRASGFAECRAVSWARKICIAFEFLGG